MTDMTDADLRAYPRKTLRCRAKVAVLDKPSLDAWTTDISQGGISLMVPDSINPGQYCVIKFETGINEKAMLFSAIARAVYTVCSSSGEYRTGFQFHDLSAANADFIAALKE